MSGSQIEREANRKIADEAGGGREPPDSQQDQARGRRAVTPWQIPWTGWKDILIRTYEQINKDRVLLVAAGVVFYELLALFPGVTAIVSSYALFAKPSTISDHLAALAGLLPVDALNIVRDQVNHVIAKGNTGLGFAFIVMIWMWMSSIVVLVGAELNAEIEHQMTADSTEGRGEPLGRRGARRADTVGEATTS